MKVIEHRAYKNEHIVEIQPKLKSDTVVGVTLNGTDIALATGANAAHAFGRYYFSAQDSQLYLRHSDVVNNSKLTIRFEKGGEKHFIFEGRSYRKTDEHTIVPLKPDATYYPDLSFVEQTANGIYKIQVRPFYLGNTVETLTINGQSYTKTHKNA